MTDVKIPALGESIASGILSKWHVKDGATVTRGQPLFELETDKITSEGQAEVSGRVTLKVAEGTEVVIGQVVATIDETAAAAAPVAAPTPTSVPAVAPAKVEAPAPKTAPAPATLSPAARRVATETQIDPATIAGTGKGGRVTKGDLLAASEATVPPPPPPALVAAPALESIPKPTASPSAQLETRNSKLETSANRVTRSKLSPLRKRIAERLVSAQQTAAILTTFNEVDMSAVMGLRKKHQESFTARHGVKLGFMSFFVKAVVHALQTIPAVNAQIEGDELVQHHFYDIGVAVGTERGLIVPVVRGCDTLTFAGIEKAILDHAKKAREGKIKIEDLQGGVFTISNGGVYGSMLSTPILNPPQSGILGLHNIKERAVVVDGQIVIRPIMYLALSYDHRVVDGKDAVTFLNRVKDAIEDPARLLFGL